MRVKKEAAILFGIFFMFLNGATIFDSTWETLKNLLTNQSALYVFLILAIFVLFLSMTRIALSKAFRDHNIPKAVNGLAVGVSLILSIGVVFTYGKNLEQLATYFGMTGGFALAFIISAVVFFLIKSVTPNTEHKTISNLMSLLVASVVFMVLITQFIDEPTFSSMIQPIIITVLLVAALFWVSKGAGNISNNLQTTSSSTGSAQPEQSKGILSTLSSHLGDEVKEAGKRKISSYFGEGKKEKKQQELQNLIELEEAERKISITAINIAAIGIKEINKHLEYLNNLGSTSLTVKKLEEIKKSTEITINNIINSLTSVIERESAALKIKGMLNQATRRKTISTLNNIISSITKNDINKAGSDNIKSFLENLKENLGSVSNTLGQVVTIVEQEEEKNKSEIKKIATKEEISTYIHKIIEYLNTTEQKNGNLTALNPMLTKLKNMLDSANIKHDDKIQTIQKQIDQTLPMDVKFSNIRAILTSIKNNL